MHIVKNTPLEFMPLRSTVAPPQSSLTLIVKGTFDIKDGTTCTPAEKQRKVSGDQPYLDDIGRSLAWASDLAPFKPRTDVYVIGSFHQPGGVAAPEGRASFTLTPMPCVPVIPAPWEPPSEILFYAGLPLATVQSKCLCTWAGEISVSEPAETIVTTNR